MKRGQASLEYILLIGAILIILIPLFYYSINQSSQDIRLNQLYDTVESIGKAVDETYALSPGTKQYVWVSIPGGIESSSFQGSTIILKTKILGKNNDVIKITKAPLTGNIPTQKGTYRIPIEHLESGIILIGYGNDTQTPTITWTSPTGLTCNPIILRANTDEPSTCKFDNNDLDYSSMSYQMIGTSIGHSYDLGAQNQNNYLYYVRCNDAYNNKMITSNKINYTINLTLCTGEGDGGGTNETIPPIINLISPESGFISNTSQIIFYYNVTDQSPIFLCRLIANQQIITTVYEPAKDISNNITGNLDLGFYNWSINCTDTHGNQGNSTSRTIEVNSTYDTDLPVVKLISPENNSVRNFNMIKFFFNVTDLSSGILSCTIKITGILDEGGTSSLEIIDSSINENSAESISISLQKGNHTWNMSCKDNSIYRNEGYSENRNLRINTTTEETFITSCPGECGYEGFSNGVCRQSAPKCTQNGETYSPEGDVYCTGGAQSNTCCCVP